MREEVDQIRQDHHATVETERMFEARVEASLTTLRREAAEEWRAFRAEQAAAEALLKRDNERRDEALAEQAARLAELTIRLDEVVAALPAGLAVQAAAVKALRRDVAEALSGWREALAEASEILETAVGQGEPPAALEERRAALRRSLRAQRSAGEG
jgi:hypothetical protein